MSTEPCGDSRLSSGGRQMKEVQYLIMTTREALELRAGKWLLQEQKRDVYC